MTRSVRTLGLITIVAASVACQQLFATDADLQLVKQHFDGSLLVSDYPSLFKDFSPLGVAKVTLGEVNTGTLYTPYDGQRINTVGGDPGSGSFNVSYSLAFQGTATNATAPNSMFHLSSNTTKYATFVVDMGAPGINSYQHLHAASFGNVHGSDADGQGFFQVPVDSPGSTHINGNVLSLLPPVSDGPHRIVSLIIEQPVSFAQPTSSAGFANPFNMTQYYATSGLGAIRVGHYLTVENVERTPPSPVPTSAAPSAVSTNNQASDSSPLKQAAGLVSVIFFAALALAA